MGQHIESSEVRIVADRGAEVPAPWSRALIAALLVGAAVSVSIGTYGHVHDPAGESVFTLGFRSVLHMKVWLATAVLVLVLFQVAAALSMWGRWDGFSLASRTWVPAAHRWAGTVAFILTLPVAYHCLWSLGFGSYNARVAVHSIAGCAFYGAFTVKLLALQLKRVPSKALPILGSVVVSLLVIVWFSSSVWFFANFGVASVAPISVPGK